MPHKPTRSSNPQRRFVIADDATVYEARDHWQEPDTHRRKRKREDDSDQEDNYGGGRAQDLSPFVRDQETYVGEATLNDVVVLVSKTLFKVPVELFQCKSNLDLGRGFFAGKYTDECPLLFKMQVFTRDNEMVDKFRSLLWAFKLSSDPLRFESIPQDPSEVDRIIDIAKITYEIELEPLYAWAQQKVIEASQNDIYMEAFSSSTLRKLVEVGDLFNNPPKRNSKSTLPLSSSSSSSRSSLAFSSIPPIFTTPCTINIIPSITLKWAHRIRQKRAPPVPAIQVAEEYGLAELKGIAYYVHLQDMGDMQSPPCMESMMVSQVRTDPKLDKPQVLRLFAGYFSLVSFWERFRRTPLELPRADGCRPEEHAKCSSVWVRRWGSAIGWSRILSYNSADALGLLACLKDQLAGDDQLKEGVHPECREAGLGLLERKRREVEANLVSHFFGCI